MSHARNKPAGWRLGQSGATAVEFAVVALLLVIVLIGTMDLGRYYLIEHSLRALAAEAARAQVNPALYSNASVNISENGPINDSFVTMTPFINDSNLTVSVQTNNAGVIGPYQITATASYTFTAISPVWSSLNGTITETTMLQY
jgi:Flp pilus assembly protein TadG